MFGNNEPSLGFNNGFEISDGEGLPANWTLWQPNQARFSRDASVAHSGSASARISNSTAGKGDAAFYLTPVEAIRSGHEYEASAWARGSRATGTNRITLAWFDASGRFLRLNASPMLPGGNSDWTPLAVRGVAPQEAAFVQLHLASKNNRGSVWFDDVTFREISP
jgi:hypothetical protein